MKILLNAALCRGYANCVVEAPELFAISDGDEIVRQTVESPPSELVMKAYAAVRSCPTQALTVATE